jgi:prolyl-tRNA synthetase
MQDGKALQCGTSHNLGQNFARVFDLKYQDEDGDWQLAWNTSWGVSTRLIGAVVMAHGDDDGLVLPPRLAPVQVVIVPIYRAKDPKDEILAAARSVRDRLASAGISVRLDDRENVNPGFKFAEWEMRGVPLRVELGPKDLQKRSVLCKRRPDRSKAFVSMDGVEEHVSRLLDEIQNGMLTSARERRDASTHAVDSFDELRSRLDGEGGFVLAHWCGRSECEERIQEETKATIRCIAFDQPAERGTCVRCDGESSRRVHFAKAY